MTARRARTTIAIAAAALAARGVIACVLVEPPADVPSDPPHAPIILHQEVVPPSTQILASWPAQFLVPIEVLDPSTVVQWHAFVDYDRITRPGFVSSGELDPDPATQAGGVRLLPATIAEPADRTACHTIEILVAHGFVENHTPDALGGDSVTWFYAPSGSLETCPLFDAGPALDAGSDAPSDGGDGASE